MGHTRLPLFMVNFSQSQVITEVKLFLSIIFFLKILTGAEVNGTPHPAVWKPSLYTPLYYLCQKALLGFLYVTLQVNVGGQLFNLLARTLQTYQHRAQSSFGTDLGEVFKCFFFSLSLYFGRHYLNATLVVYIVFFVSLGLRPIPV